MVESCSSCMALLGRAPCARGSAVRKKSARGLKRVRFGQPRPTSEKQHFRRSEALLNGFRQQSKAPTSVPLQRLNRELRVRQTAVRNPKFCRQPGECRGSAAIRSDAAPVRPRISARTSGQSRWNDCEDRLGRSQPRHRRAEGAAESQLARMNPCIGVLRAGKLC
jgi:hypothetical protein